MEAIQFVQLYQNYLSEIEKVIKPELIYHINELRKIDPHELVRPDDWFQSEMNARGYVWSLFLRECKKDSV